MRLRSAARAAAALAILVAFVAASQTSAEAHAVLVRSSPASQSGLPGSPGSIDLWFSEPLEPEFSRFELFAGDGTALRLDGMRVDPADAQHLSALPRALNPGIYTVVYRTLSTRDGHEWSGSFTFTILNEDGTVPTGAAFAPDLGGGNSPQEIVGRWFTFGGFSIVLGGALVLVFAWSDGRAWRETTTALYLRLSLAALPLVAAGSILQLNAQHEALGGALSALLTESRFGTFWLWRAAAVLALTAAVGAALSTPPGRWRNATLAALPLLASGALFTVTMLSHAAAAPGRGWAIAADFAHLALAAAWVGGLLFLAALFVRARRTEASDEGLLRLVGRFSIFAAAALYALGGTGVVRTIGELPTAGALIETGYGRWLLAKLALLLPVLIVALINRRLLGQLSAGAIDAAKASRRLRRMLLLEAALAAVVLLSVATLGQVPTARGGEVVQSSSAAVPFNGIEQVDDLSVHLQVMPARFGVNELRLHLYHPDGSDVGPVEQVRLNLSTRLGGAGGDQVEAVPKGQGIFAATAAFASLSLTWEVSVDVRRGGFDDARTAFSVPVAAGGGSRSGRGLFASPAPQLDVNVVWALLLVMAGVAALSSIRRNGTARGRTVRWAGVGAIFVAGVLAISAEQHLHGGAPLTNPSAGDATSAARGEPLFVTNCATCHGLSGRGDGPSAAGLTSPPADLTVHVPLHTDGDTFSFISGGLPGTSMPAWADRLTEQQMWDLVNYLRSEFAQARQPAR